MIIINVTIIMSPNYSARFEEVNGQNSCHKLINNETKKANDLVNLVIVVLDSKHVQNKDRSEIAFKLVI